MSDDKKFKMIDEEFVCINCGKLVTPLGYSARDHCPNCLVSLHVDVNPGDRNNKCHGKLIPIEIEKFKDSYKIIYKCEKCGQLHKNIMAKDDSLDKIIEIAKKVG